MVLKILISLIEYIILIYGKYNTLLTINLLKNC